jgi:serine/threonine protein phosphatase PrpC
MYIVTATAPGSTHTNPGQPGKINNQDAIAQIINSDSYVIVLCDGCGSQPHSGTGADIGAHLIAHAINNNLTKCSKLDQLDWDVITEEIKKSLRIAVGFFDGDGSTTTFEKMVVERFLFTAMVVVIKHDIALVTSFGDGIVIVDEEAIELEPPILNSPPYIGYLLLNKSAYHSEELKSHLAFSVIDIINLSEIEKSLIVGTDGLRELIDDDLHHPALVQPKSLQRWLNAQTTEHIHKGSFIAGKCPDDVSLVIIRTDETQKKLIESRREVVELKRSVAQLQANVGRVTQELDLMTISREVAEEKVSKLNDELKQTKVKAKKAELFETELESLQEAIDKLRKDLHPTARPLLSIIDSLMKIWNRGSSDPELSSDSSGKHTRIIWPTNRGGIRYVPPDNYRVIPAKIQVNKKTK